MPRLAPFLGALIAVSPSCCPGAFVAELADIQTRGRDPWASCSGSDAAPSGEQLPSEEERDLHFGLLQVSTRLDRGESRAHQEAAVDKGPPQSPFGDLVGGNVTLPLFGLAVLLPHLGALFTARFLLRSHEKNAAEALREEEQLEAPRSLSYIVQRVGPMWIIHLLGIFSVAAAAPSLPYLYLNYFSRRYGHEPVDCAIDMAASPCSRAAVDVMQIHVWKGLATPFVQFLTGPGLGAISDSLGRRPAILAIRVSMVITSVTSAAVAWFNLSVWWDFWIGFLAMIPFFAVPTAWYIDRIDHAPSIVFAITLVEGSCILSGMMGALLGSVLSMKKAILVGFLFKLVDLFLAIFCLPESLPEEKRIPFSWWLLLPSTSFRSLLQSPLVKKLTAIGVIDAFHYTGWATILARFLQQHFAWSRHDTYLGGLLDAVSAMAWMGLGVNVLLHHFGRVGLLATTTISVGIASSMVMLAHQPWQIFVQCGLFGGLPLMSSAVLVAIIGKASSAEQQGMLQSSVNLATQASGALGGACFAIVYQFLDPTAPGAHGWKMGAYIFYGALFLIPSLSLTLSLRREIEDPPLKAKALTT